LGRKRLGLGVEARAAPRALNMSAQAASGERPATRRVHRSRKQGEQTRVVDKAGSERSAESKRASFVKHVDFLKEAGHFFLFAVLAFVSCLSLGRRLPQGSRLQQDVGSMNSTGLRWTTTAVRPFLMLGLGLIVFSAATEVLQFLVLTRTPTIKDWLFDLAGICLSFILFLAYRYLRRRGRS